MTDMTPEEFELLAATDTKAWLDIVCQKTDISSRFKAGSICEILELDEDDKVLGMHLQNLGGEGGSEGGGEYMDSVIAIINSAGKAIKHIRFTGSYSSWDSSEWDEDFTEVFPVKYVADDFFSEREILDMKNRGVKFVE